MAVIDEKGRLFGKINIIDFLVIVFLLCLVPMFYFGYKVSTTKPVIVSPERELIEIKANCRLIKLKPEVLKLISVGDKELDENGQVIGEIISLGESVPYSYEFNIGRGQKIIKQDPILKQMEARLKLKAEVKQDNLYYKDKPIKIDSPLEFVTNKYSFEATPLKEEQKEEKLEERIIDLYVTLKDLDEDTLKQISIGDKELDENGNIIAEILKLGNIENNSLEFDLGASNFIIGEDSRKKQIFTKMRLRCQIKNGKQLYFKDKRVRVSSLLEFKTDKYRVMGLIAKAFKITLPLEEKWISLQVKFSGVLPEVANVVQKGDIEKDAFEKTVARISSIISNKQSQVLTLKEDEFISLKHPFNKDILASLDVRCIEKEGVYYYKNYPVKMGNNIVFATDLYSISGVIVGMEIR
jgi:predicted protein tyrosine phosphatase